ncbi:gallinacin-6-like [Lagopus muta]|uniref:gallinacin-6-like n=1 Tax=Lagopus muta TaxID=64668 RepID=UPI00209DD7FD|nr:gallinacin-6-like [Lagopus muta]
MRILYLLLAVLFVVLQAVAGEPSFSSPMHACRHRRGVCIPGRCRQPYYRVGSCGAISSCCVRGRWT